MPDARTLGGDLEGALERVNVPSFVLDDTGVVRWVNRAARRLVGDVRGRHFTSVAAPEEKLHSQERFAQNVLGVTAVRDAEIVLLDAHHAASTKYSESRSSPSSPRNPLNKLSEPTDASHGVGTDRLDGGEGTDECLDGETVLSASRRQTGLAGVCRTAI